MARRPEDRSRQLELESPTDPELDRADPGADGVRLNGHGGIPAEGRGPRGQIVPRFTATALRISSLVQKPSAATSVRVQRRQRARCRSGLVRSGLMPSSVCWPTNPGSPTVRGILVPRIGDPAGTHSVARHPSAEFAESPHGIGHRYSCQSRASGTASKSSRISGISLA